MKYFTAKLYSGLNSRNSEVVESADERGHADNRRDADDDPEDCEGGAQLVRPQRVERQRHDLAQQQQVQLLAPQRFDRIESRRP